MSDKDVLTRERYEHTRTLLEIGYPSSKQEARRTLDAHDAALRALALEAVEGWRAAEIVASQYVGGCTISNGPNTGIEVIAQDPEIQARLQRIAAILKLLEVEIEIKIVKGEQ